MAKYSDFTMKVATQIAYMNFNPLDIVNNPKWTVKDHLENNKNLADDMLSRDPDAYYAIMDETNEHYCGDWKIKNVELNENSGNGFAACLIETGDRQAIVGFRGTETTKGLKSLYDDVLCADVGLLNSTETGQQQSAREYMERINREYGHLYDKYATTGHSLGGNLAEHATVTAPDGMREKITQTLNLDGPGFSDEYIKKYGKEIEEVADIVEHKQVSWCGTLLNPLPGTKYATYVSSDKDSWVWKHSTANMHYDQNGNMIPGMPDAAEMALSAASKALDNNTSIPGIWGLLSTMFIRNSRRDFNIVVDSIKELFTWFNDARNNYIAAQAESVFEIHTPELDNIADVLGRAQTQLSEYSHEVMNIKNNIHLIIKLSAIYTLGYKLGNISNNIGKVSTKSGAMSNAARDIVEMYTDCENKIISNAE